MDNVSFASPTSKKTLRLFNNLWQAINKERNKRLWAISGILLLSSTVKMFCSNVKVHVVYLLCHLCNLSEAKMHQMLCLIT